MIEKVATTRSLSWAAAGVAAIANTSADAASHCLIIAKHR
jgi:hypothetical protein